MLCYGHNSNFIYFTFYGITLAEAEYDSVAMIMRYDESVPNYKLKASLLHDDSNMSKRPRFYHDYVARTKSNLCFMAKCRFYWFAGDPHVLCSVWLFAEKQTL